MLRRGIIATGKSIHSSEQIMATFEPGEIIERIDITHDLMVLRVKPRQTIDFRPGQFVRLGLEIGGRILQRSYSIVSAPGDPYLEFLFELVPEGKLTPKIWELAVGDPLLIHGQSAGVFLLDAEKASRHLMAATVTGIAPFVSMVRERARGGTSSSDDRMLLIHGASRAADLAYYAEELQESTRHGWLTYVPTVSRPWEDPTWEGEVGRIEDVLRKHADAAGFDHANAMAYASGHPQMIEIVKSILLRAGYPKERLLIERYFPLRAVK